jgi:hypothetical protein
MLCPTHGFAAPFRTDDGQPLCYACVDARNVPDDDWRSPPSRTVAQLVQQLMADRRRRQEADVRAVERRLRGSK